MIQSHSRDTAGMKYTFVNRRKWCTDEGKNYHAHRWIEKEMISELKLRVLKFLKHNTAQKFHLNIFQFSALKQSQWLSISFQHRKTKQNKTISKPLNAFPAWECAGCSLCMATIHIISLNLVYNGFNLFLPILIFKSNFPLRSKNPQSEE